MLDLNSTKRDLEEPIYIVPLTEGRNDKIIFTLLIYIKSISFSLLVKSFVECSHQILVYHAHGACFNSYRAFFNLYTFVSLPSNMTPMPCCYVFWHESFFMLLYTSICMIPYLEDPSAFLPSSGCTTHVSSS